MSEQIECIWSVNDIHLSLRCDIPSYVFRGAGMVAAIASILLNGQKFSHEPLSVLYYRNEQIEKTGQVNKLDLHNTPTQ